MTQKRLTLWWSAYHRSATIFKCWQHYLTGTAFVCSVSATQYRVLDLVLCLGMLGSSLLALVRGLGAFDSSFPPIQNYVAHYESYILEPSNFGKAWVVYAAMYGVPFQVGNSTTMLVLFLQERCMLKLYKCKLRCSKIIVLSCFARRRLCFVAEPNENLLTNIRWRGQRRNEKKAQFNAVVLYVFSTRSTLSNCPLFQISLTKTCCASKCIYWSIY